MIGNSLKSLLAAEGVTLKAVIETFNTKNPDLPAYVVPNIRNKISRQTIRAKEISDLLSVIGYCFRITSSDGRDLPEDVTRELIKMNIIYIELEKVLNLLGYNISFIKK